jgi:hypothetical protein
MANLNRGSLSIYLKAAAPRCAGGPLRGCLSSPRCTINPDGCRRRTTTPVLRLFYSDIVGSFTRTTFAVDSSQSFDQARAQVQDNESILHYQRP